MKIIILFTLVYLLFQFAVNDVLEIRFNYLAETSLFVLSLLTVLFYKRRYNYGNVRDFISCLMPFFVGKIIYLSYYFFKQELDLVSFIILKSFTLLSILGYAGLFISLFLFLFRNVKPTTLEMSDSLDENLMRK